MQTRGVRTARQKETLERRSGSSDVIGLYPGAELFAGVHGSSRMLTFLEFIMPGKEAMSSPRTGQWETQLNTWYIADNAARATSCSASRQNSLAKSYYVVKLLQKVLGFYHRLTQNN